MEPSEVLHFKIHSRYLKYSQDKIFPDVSLEKNICNSNPNRNPCFLTEKSELSSETGKVLHHQGRQCEASEGLKFRDLTIHGVVSWQRWRLEMSSSSSRGHQFWCSETEVFTKPENFGDMTWVEFRTPKSIRCHDSARNGAGLYMLTINLPVLRYQPPTPGRGSQMRSMKRLELPNNAATGASAALLTSRDKASKSRQESFSYVRCGLGYLWSNKKTFFRDQHLMNKPVVLMVTMNHHFHWDDWMIWGSPIFMAKNEAMLPASAVFGAALPAIFGHVGVLWVSLRVKKLVKIGGT